MKKTIIPTNVGLKTKFLVMLALATGLFSCTKTPNNTIVGVTPKSNNFVCSCETMTRNIGLGGSTYTYSNAGQYTISGVDSGYAVSICASHESGGALEQTTCTLHRVK